MFKSMLKMSLITLGCMYGANLLSSMNPTARKLLKGSVVAAVPSANGKVSNGGKSPIWDVFSV